MRYRRAPYCVKCAKRVYEVQDAEGRRFLVASFDGTVYCPEPRRG